MQIKENDKCHELQVHVGNRFFSFNQPNPTMNNHQKKSSEGPGCDNDELHFDINCNKLHSNHLKVHIKREVSSYSVKGVGTQHNIRG
jgi:hypothetical protein